jgi:hypothetical protein
LPTGDPAAGTLGSGAMEFEPEAVHCSTIIAIRVSSRLFSLYRISGLLWPPMQLDISVGN